MTGSTPSDEQRLLIAGYILHTLSAEEAASFEQLMKNHPEMVEELEQMQADLETVYNPPPVQPPAHLRAAVLEAHSAAIAQPSSATPSSREGQYMDAVPTAVSRRRQPLRWGAIAALLIAVLGISNILLWRRLQNASMTAQTDNVLVISLQPTADEQTAMARVIVEPDELTAELIVENLPTLPEDQVYALWTVLEPGAPYTTDDKNAILTKAFTVDQPNAPKQISLPPVYQEPEWIKAIAITIEAADAPQRHVASPILIETL